MEICGILAYLQGGKEGTCRSLKTETGFYGYLILATMNRSTSACEQFTAFNLSHIF